MTTALTDAAVRDEMVRLRDLADTTITILDRRSEPSLPEPDLIDRATSVAYIETPFGFSFGTTTNVPTTLLTLTNDHVTSDQDIEVLEKEHGPCVLRMLDEDMHFFSKATERVDDPVIRERAVREVMRNYVSRIPKVPVGGTTLVRSEFGEVEWQAMSGGFPAGSDRLNRIGFTHKYTSVTPRGKRRMGHVDRALMPGNSGGGLWRRAKPAGAYSLIGVVKGMGTTRRKDGSIQHWGEACLFQDIEWLPPVGG